ncbi:hypothetical protein pdam_00013346, partial [Pocillopora damicornis]
MKENHELQLGTPNESRVKLAYKGYVSAFLMIFCVSYNMNPPKMTSPPYVTTDCKPTATIELAGRNNVPEIPTEHVLQENNKHIPRHAIHTPPRPMAKGPPHDRNLPSGAQAAVRDKAPTTPPVTAAALSTNGPPSNMRGAIRFACTLRPNFAYDHIRIFVNLPTQAMCFAFSPASYGKLIHNIELPIVAIIPPPTT